MFHPIDFFKLTLAALALPLEPVACLVQ